MIHSNGELQYCRFRLGVGAPKQRYAHHLSQLLMYTNELVSHAVSPR